MSSTVRAIYAHLGKGGDYPVEMNYAIRIYTPKESIPDVGVLSATLKGGQRTNHHGIVPLLDGKKQIVGSAEVTEIVSARPEHMKLEHIIACGFGSMQEAVNYAKSEHEEEFARDGVLTVFYYKVAERHEPRPLK
jgi:hypothetical protein